MRELTGEDLTDHIEHLCDGVTCDCTQEVLPEITEVQRYTYKPGDRFIVRVAGEVFSREQADEIARHFKEVMHLPGDVPVVMIDECVDVEIVSPE